MSTETLLLIIIISLVVGVLPAWPHSKEWGYAPTSILTILLVLFIIWAVASDRPLFRSRSRLGQDIRNVGQDMGDSMRRATR